MVEKSEIRIQAFGRSCHIVIGDADSRGNELLLQCQEELERVEEKFSSFSPDSIVSRLNQSAGTGYFVPLDPEARSLFQLIDALRDESKRVFDPTTRILQDCYSSSNGLLAS